QQVRLRHVAVLFGFAPLLVKVPGGNIRAEQSRCRQQAEDRRTRPHIGLTGEPLKSWNRLRSGFLRARAPRRLPPPRNPNVNRATNRMCDLKKEAQWT